MTCSEKKKRIPTFHSDGEEREFWARHSVEEFARDLNNPEIEIRPPRTEQIALRLYKEDIEVLRSRAAARSVGHATLAGRTVPGRLARAVTKQEESNAPPEFLDARRDRYVIALRR